MRARAYGETSAQQPSCHAAPTPRHALGTGCIGAVRKLRSVPVLLLFLVAVSLSGELCLFAQAKASSSQGSKSCVSSSKSSPSSSATSGSKTSTSSFSSASSGKSSSSSSSGGKSTVSKSKWYGDEGGVSKTGYSEDFVSYNYRSTRYYAYHRSYGVSNPGSTFAGLSILDSLMFINANYYPGLRFRYNNTNYYDDCALRNITAQRSSLYDTAVNLSTVNALPQLIPGGGAATADILSFNATLYNVTNGLIVQSDYCNSKYDNGTATAASASGGAGMGLRWDGGLALALTAVLAAAAAAWLG